MIRDVKLLIDGNFIKSDSKEKLLVINPADQKVLARVPMCSKNDINLAVAGAQKAQENWRNIPVSERMRVMLKYQELLKKNMKALAAVGARSANSCVRWPMHPHAGAREREKFQELKE